MVPILVLGYGKFTCSRKLLMRWLISGFPNQKSWKQEWPGENGVTYGRCSMQVTNQDSYISFQLTSFDVPLWQGIMSDSMYGMVLFHQQENPDHKGPFYVKQLVEPPIKRFKASPPAQITAEQGSDLILQWEFTYHIDTIYSQYERYPDRIVSLAQYIDHIDPNSPVFRPLYKNIQSKGGKLITKEPRMFGQVEQKRQGNDLDVIVTLMITDIQPNDQSTITCRIDGTLTRPIIIELSTEIIVAPNSEFFPVGYIGVALDPWDSPDASYVSITREITCMGIGNDISTTYLTKDGVEPVKDDQHIMAELKRVSANKQFVTYRIRNVSGADFGTYACNAKDTSGRLVRVEKPSVVPERTVADIKVVSWSSDQVLKIIQTLFCRTGLVQRLPYLGHAYLELYSITL